MSTKAIIFTHGQSVDTAETGRLLRVTGVLGAGAFVAKSEAVKLLVPTIKRILEENRPV